MGKLNFDPEAKLEIKEAAAYYDACRPGLGKEFLAAVETSVQHLIQNPLRWRKLDGRFRRSLVKRFPYGIVYAVDESAIFIAAVMHLKRKPGYWRERLKN